MLHLSSQCILILHIEIFELTTRLVYILDVSFSATVFYIHTSFPRVERDQKINPEEQNTVKTKINPGSLLIFAAP